MFELPWGLWGWTPQFLALPRTVISVLPHGVNYNRLAFTLYTVWTQLKIQMIKSTGSVKKWSMSCCFENLLFTIHGSKIKKKKRSITNCRLWTQPLHSYKAKEHNSYLSICSVIRLRSGPWLFQPTGYFFDNSNSAEESDKGCWKKKWNSLQQTLGGRCREVCPAFVSDACSDDCSVEISAGFIWERWITLIALDYFFGICWIHHHRRQYHHQQQLLLQ